MDIPSQDTHKDVLVIEVFNQNRSEQSLVIDGNQGRRVIPPGEKLTLTVLPTTVFVLRAERMNDPDGASVS